MVVVKEELDTTARKNIKQIVKGRLLIFYGNIETDKDKVAAAIDGETMRQVKDSVGSYYKGFISSNDTMEVNMTSEDVADVFIGR